MFYGKTSIRAGFGIYYGNGQFGSLGDPIGNISTAYTLYNQSYPVSENAGTGTNTSPTGADIHRKDTAANEWTVSIQQQIAARTIFQLAYFGTGVEHVFNDTVTNPYNPVTKLGIYPGHDVGFDFKEFTTTPAPTHYKQVFVAISQPDCSCRSITSGPTRSTMEASAAVSRIRPKIPVA